MRKGLNAESRALVCHVELVETSMNAPYQCYSVFWGNSSVVGIAWVESRIGSFKAYDSQDYLEEK
jgi:hypothetical protein